MPELERCAKENIAGTSALRGRFFVLRMERARAAHTLGMKRIFLLLFCLAAVINFSFSAPKTSAQPIKAQGAVPENRGTYTQKSNGLLPQDGLPAAKTGTESLAGDSVRLPILMYHGVLKSKQGIYIVSPAQLENDLSAVKSAGYTFVTVKEVEAYASGTGDLPKKPLLVTFDDGYYNNYYYALPILKKHGAKALLSVVGAYTAYSAESGDKDNPNYSHVTWEEIGELARSGVFEIGNHTYDMHRYSPRFGASQKRGESAAEYKTALRRDVGRLQETLFKKSGVTPVAFAYPFGKYNDAAREVLTDMGFTVLLTCNEGVSIVRRSDPSSVLCLKRFNRDGRLSTAELLKEVETGKYRPAHG